MRQRVLIGIGLAADPQAAHRRRADLGARRHRAAGDPRPPRAKLTREKGTSVLLITHDLGLAAERAEQLVVMYNGEIVESGPSRRDPREPAAPVHAATRRCGAEPRVDAASSPPPRSSTLAEVADAVAPHRVTRREAARRREARRAPSRCRSPTSPRTTRSGWAASAPSRSGPSTRSRSRFPAARPSPSWASRDPASRPSRRWC